MHDDSDDDKAFREAFGCDFSEDGEEGEGDKLVGEAFGEDFSEIGEEEEGWEVDVSQEKFSYDEGTAFEEEEEDEEGEGEEEEDGAIDDCGRVYLHLEATDWLDGVEAGIRDE
ncbi:unnamed protein product [Chondrus crispus]|uniref:Uncharacterized protein n=1 Tax=Chondrus crispus TaxID=2769 RepID=R7QFT0_CHOCR|nr:unnamed protein product [Chondrus crispus]CDF36311.1 unnamed protein product [Chondrus crispus]|eukprot:XP_005716130.1 unnamed protein product [Chondrus crispus]